MNEILTSKDLEIFLNKIRNSTNQFNINFANVGDYDKQKGDYEHAIEFEKSYRERNKINIRYHKMLNDRRDAKDMIVKCEDAYDFAEQNKQVIKKLEQLLGNMWKKEEWLKNRTYNKRCRDENIV